MRLKRAQEEEGVVLLLVLVILVLTVSSVYAFARTALLEVSSTRQRGDRVRASFVAESGIAVATRALMDDLNLNEDPVTRELETHEDGWYRLGEVAVEVPDDAVLEITVRDLGSRINLNALVGPEGNRHSDSRGFLRAALERIIEQMPGRAEEKFYDPEELSEAVLDWIDADERTRLGDAEDAFYHQRGADGEAPNRRLVSLAELDTIPGVDDALLRRLEAYFTTLPLHGGIDTAGVNPNTAPPHVLGLIYQGTSDDLRLVQDKEVFAILKLRDEGRMYCPASTEDPCVSFQQEIRGGQTVFPPLSYRNGAFRIRSEARYRNAYACFEAVVDRSNGQEVKTFSYARECST